MTDRARHPRAVAAAAIAALIGIGATPGAEANASAASPAATPLSACTPTHGTIVAVDFGHWGGPVVRGCGIGRHSGYDLLHAAGFTTAGDEHDGPAFVCRLGDSAFRDGRQYPTPSQEPCTLTPPANAYWSFWLAPSGQNHWTYSQLGAMSEAPRPGEVELWTFGATNIAGTRGSGVPRYSPAAVRARAATRTPQRHPATTHAAQAAPRTASTTASATATATTSTTATTRTTTTAATTTSAASATATRPSASTPSTSTTPAPAAPRHHRARRHRTRPDRRTGHRAVTTDPTTTTTAATSGAPRLVAARPTSQRDSSGSATPLIVGGGAAALLVAGAGWTAWRRRRLE